MKAIAAELVTPPLHWCPPQVYMRYSSPRRSAITYNSLVNFIKFYARELVVDIDPTCDSRFDHQTFFNECSCDRLFHDLFFVGCFSNYFSNYFFDFFVRNTGTN